MGPPCRLKVAWLLQNSSGSRHRADHEPIPGGQDLIISGRRHPFGPRPLHLAYHSREHLLLGDPQLRLGISPKENILIPQRLGITVIDKITGGRKAEPVPGSHELRVAQESLQFLLGPAPVFPFLPLALGILRTEKSTLLVSELLQHIVRDCHRGLPEPRIIRDLPGLDINIQQLGLVVEHLLKMRHKPHWIHGITVEATTDLIMDPPLHHLAARPHREIPSPTLAAQEKEQVGRLGKLLLSTPAPVNLIRSGQKLLWQPLEEVPSENRVRFEFL